MQALTNVLSIITKPLTTRHESLNKAAIITFSRHNYIVKGYELIRQRQFFFVFIHHGGGSYVRFLSLASFGIIGEGAPSLSQCVGLER